MGLKRPSSKVESKVAKRPAAKVTPVAKLKKPAAQTGKKGILRKKPIPPSPEVEGQEEEENPAKPATDLAEDDAKQEKKEEQPEIN